MATLSSILAWEIPWMGEPGRPQSLGSQSLGYNLETKAYQQITKGIGMSAGGNCLQDLGLSSDSPTWHSYTSEKEHMLPIRRMDSWEIRTRPCK